MPKTRQTGTIDQSLNRWPRPIWDGVSRTLVRVVAVILASALVIRLVSGLRLGPTEVLLLGGVLIVAAAFGLVSGLLAAVIGLAAYHLLNGAAIAAFDLSSRDGLLLAVYAVSLTIIGLYTDRVRQKDRQARSLLELVRPLPTRPSDRSIGQLFALARRRDPATRRTLSGLQVERALVGICIIACGLIVAFTLQARLGLLGGVLVALASVLLAAGLTGARFGLAAGLSVGIALTAFLRNAPHAATSPAGQAFDLAVFAALGWGVGMLCDQLRHEREAMKTLVNAGRELSSGADEAANRQMLYDSLRQIGHRAVVQLFDEHGALFPTDVAGSPHASHPPAPDQDDRWRTHRLAADGRDVGFVRWRFGGSQRDARESDLVAVSLIELGASAIVRARLNTEKAEMEYSARAEQLRAILLDTVSHHFRSPLAGILGSVTSILSMPDRHDRSARHELLLIIKEQANRLGRYVDNFLSLARLESGSIEITASDISIESLIYDVWDTFGESGSARRYLHVEVDPNPVRSDASLLAQVLGNVLENAIKYSPEESVVRVRDHRRGDQLTIEVSDQGCGVPPGNVERMFERFYRSQGAKAPGLGLGLYITRSLVEMLGGTVQAHNRSDGGAGLVVLITLPISGPSP